MTPADLRAFRPSPPITAEAWLSWEQEDPPSGSTTEVDPIVRTIFRPPTFASRDSVLS
jgi:hypothetical protein